MQIRIDPEFRDKIPPLTPAEFDQLEQNILADGEVYEPIIVWNGAIIDGHNRWKIINAHPEIPYKVKEMYFPDVWAAFDWMYSKQLGRRNLSEENRAYIIGKMYEARKKSHGASDGFRGNQSVSYKNYNLAEKPPKTHEVLANEVGVSPATVTNAEKFAKGVDVIKAQAPAVANQILHGGSGVTKQAVAAFPKLDKAEQDEFIEQVSTGKVKEANEKAKVLKKTASLESCNATPITHKEEYNEKDFADQVGSFPKEFDDMIRLFLLVHGDMLSNPVCAEAFDAMLSETEKVIEKYREVKK